MRSRTLIYASLTAVVCAGLVVVQSTEFGIKVAILSSLVLTCALTPAIDRFAARYQARRAGEPLPEPDRPPFGQRVLQAAKKPVLVVIFAIAVAAPINTALLGLDDKIILIERGLTTRQVQ